MFKKKRFILAAIGLPLFFVLALVFYLFFTESGLNLFIKAALSGYVKSEDVEIKKIEGTLPQAVSFQDISLENLKYMPPGTLLEIKKLDVYVNPFKIEDSHLNIHNGRLNIPGSDPVLFHGTYKDGLLDFDVYSKSLNVSQIRGLIQNPGLGDISGTIDALDIYIKGRLFEPELTGGFHVQTLSRQGFLISDCQVSLDLMLKEIIGAPDIYGDIDLNNGQVSGPKTAVVKILSGKILFKGRSEEPFFDLKGISNVGGVKINVELKGTIEKPDIRLSSEPSLPKGLLLLMLATDKSWKDIEGVLNQGQVSADIAKDFIDYFFFAGTGSRIARYFGISDVFLKYDGQTRGIGVKKDIIGKAEVSYSIEQPQEKEERPVTTHKIGGEVRVTDTVSVEAERELKEDQEAVKPEDKTQSSDTLFLKYKKQF